METWERHDFPAVKAIGPAPARYDFQLLLEMSRGQREATAIDDHTILVIEDLKRIEAARAREDAKPPAEAPVAKSASARKRKPRT